MQENLDIQPGAADDQDPLATPRDVVDRGARQRAETGAVERLVGLDDVDEVMRNRGTLLRRRLGAAAVAADRSDANRR